MNFIITKDGSPTLDWSAGDSTETMHSREGALSETDYIYGTALRKTLELKLPAKVLSMGLGLAYVEFFSISLLQDLKILSFEKDEELRERFLSWLNGEEIEPYDQIIEKTEELLDVTELKEKARHLFKSKNWILKEELSFESKEKYSCLLYDAFSGQSQPDLWTEDHLDLFLKTYAEDQCVFATYAATGSLKRVLKNHGFVVERRKGFAHKRESTLAWRD